MIVWDEPKRVSNLAKHGLDFADVTPESFACAGITRSCSGRLIAVGGLDGGLVKLIFLPMGREGLSVISMRPASRKERRRMP
ncbi:MAG: BrnT family toxin [Gemmobacter sp.]